MSNLSSRLLAQPLYMQVRDLLVRRIVEGRWKPGQSLPNENMLAQELGTSIGTVRKALDIMEEERILNRRQGRGTFVTNFSEQPLVFSGFVDPTGETIVGAMQAQEHSFTTASKEEASRLKIRAGDDIIRIDRIRLHRGMPFLTETCRLPGKLFKKLPEELASYRVSALAQRNAIIATYAEETIEAVVASPADARTLNVASGTPLLAVDRVVMSSQGEVLEWRVGRGLLTDVRYINRLPFPAGASRPARSDWETDLGDGASQIMC